MKRRNFLKLLGIGTAATAVPVNIVSAKTKSVVIPTRAERSDPIVAGNEIGIFDDRIPIAIGTIMAWPKYDHVIVDFELGQQIRPRNIPTVHKIYTGRDWLECDGSYYSPFYYPELYKVLGKDTLPDWRATFPRFTG